jgi:tetratricopeptide (TPR) repeat protein
LGREKDAIRAYEKISPQNKKILSILAGHYLREKKYDRAIRNYQKILKLEPKKASSWAALGYAWLASGNPDQAIENYLQALKYEREDDEIYANLGIAYEKKRLYPEALKAYRSAYEINPETRVASRIPRLRILLLREKDDRGSES